jgi:hypothetical protein
MMHGVIRLVALGLVLLFCRSAVAQVELPRPSPSAKVSQVVGLTEITVDYSSPAVHGRKIFGGLLPEGQLWRTGANAATKISFSRDATVASHPVPAGSYSLFSIPGRSEWTVILNKNPTASANEYKQAEDLLRFTAKPRSAPKREHLTFLFSEFDNAGATLDLEWDTVRVSIPIKVDTDKQALAAISNIENSQWRQYNQAARYMLEQKKDYDAGLKLVEKSLAIHEDWQNLWTKAALLASMGDYKRALPLAEKAKTLGEALPSQQFFFATDVRKAVSDWKKKQ